MAHLLPLLPKSRTTLLLLLLASIALLAGFYAPNIINTIVSNQQSDLPVETSQYCALSTQQCEKKGVEIKLGIDIAKPLEATHIDVNWQDNQSDKLMLTLRGLKMDLGVVKFPILKQQDGQYQGTIVLPICTDTKMTWIGTLTDQQGNKVYTSIRMEK